MIKITFNINLKCTANCDDLVEAYIEEAKYHIKNGLKKDLKRLYGVSVSEISVEVDKIEKGD